MNSEVSLTKEEKTALKKEKKSKRIWELDFFRGVLIIAMIIDHVFCTLSKFGFINNFLKYDGDFPSWFIGLQSFSNTVWTSSFREYGRYLLMFLLFFISGCCSKFSKNNLSRGIKITLVGLGIFLVTWIMYSFGIDYIIVFGTISCFGVSMTIYAIFKKLIEKFVKNESAHKWIILGLAIVFILVGLYLGTYLDMSDPNGSRHMINYIGVDTEEKNMFANIDYINYLRPAKLANEELNISNFFPMVFGRYYYGDDWLGLFPSLGYFFLGAFVSEIVYTKEKLAKRINFDMKANKITAPVNFFGYHSLVFYLGHMFVIYFILMIPFLILGWHF